MGGVEVKPTYEVLTWDHDPGEWTPQQGCSRGPYTKWGLRRALRSLRQMGYDTGGAFVFIEKLKPAEPVVLTETPCR